MVEYNDIQNLKKNNYNKNPTIVNYKILKFCFQFLKLNKLTLFQTQRICC